MKFQFTRWFVLNSQPYSWQPMVTMADFTPGQQASMTRANLDPERVLRAINTGRKSCPWQLLDIKLEYDLRARRVDTRTIRLKLRETPLSWGGGNE